MSKTNYKILTNPKYMGAYSMDNGNDAYFEIPAVITAIKVEQVVDPTGKSKPCMIGYTNQSKPFIINAGSQKVLQQITKSRYVEDWTGAKIIFYVAIDQRNPSGGLIDALRIKPAPAEIVDYSIQEQMLKECKTIDDLAVIYKSLTKDQQIGTLKLKDELKIKLSNGNK